MDISKFKYVIGMKKLILAQKQEILKRNRIVESKDRTSTGDRLARMRASKKMAGFIDVLIRSRDEGEHYLGKQLKLEREYVRKKEKNHLYWQIAKNTGQEVGGSYTLAEIGNVLGLTRERVRQIEQSAIKIMKHPTALRKLKEMKIN